MVGCFLFTVVQAVGRAQMLRNDCTVYLYSGYPIPSYKEEDVKVTKLYKGTKIIASER